MENKRMTQDQKDIYLVLLNLQGERLRKRHEAYMSLGERTAAQIASYYKLLEEIQDYIQRVGKIEKPSRLTIV